MPENRKKEPRRLGRFSIDMGLVEHQTVMAQLMLSGTRAKAIRAKYTR